MSGFVPTFEHEINRKVLSTVHNLMARFRFGDISKGQFETALQTIWDCTAGIIQDEIQEIVVELMSDKPSGCIERRLFVKPSNEVALIEHHMKDHAVLVISGIGFSGDPRKVRLTYEASSNPALAAKESFEAICEELGKRYREV